ncbi:MAG: endo-1,3-alpha-glucanase family glycosylhydrolase [Candidatus Binatia bacterium]
MNTTLIALTALVLALPLLRRMVERRFDPLEPLVVFAVCWGVMFVARPAAEVLRGELVYVRLTRIIHLGGAFTEALALGLAGAVAFTVVYEIGIGQRLAARLPSPPTRFSTRRTVVATLGLATIAGLALALFVVRAGVTNRSGLQQFLAGRSLELTEVQKGATFLAQTSLALVPATLALVAVAWNRRSLALWALVPVLLALVLLRAVPVGSRMMLLPFAGGLVVYFYLARRRRPSLLQLVAVAVVGLVASHVLLRTRGAQLHAPLTIAEALSEAITDPGSVLAPLTSGGDTEMAPALAAVLQVVPEKIPFTYGAATVGDLLVRPIPRALWAGKPLPPREKLIDALWPEEYWNHVANPEFSVLLTFYLDFGVVGVILGLAAYGILARAAFEYLRRHPASTAVQLLYSLGLPFLVIALRDSPVDTINRAAFMWLPMLGILRVARLEPASRGSRRIPMRALRTGLAVVIVALASGAVAASTALPAPRSCMLPLAEPRPPSAFRKKVFAHYFSPFPISVDNQDPAADAYSRLVTPEGELGKYREAGGYIRERPLPRPPRPETDWRARDMEEEVRRATAIGLDGFAFDILGTSGPTWERLKLLLAAAHRVAPDFRILLMPDMNGELKEHPDHLVPTLEALATHPAVLHHPDGRLVVSPFNAAAQSAGWWSEQLAALRKRGIGIALVPLFLNWRNSAAEFTGISAGLSAWGPRTPSRARTLAADATEARQRAGFWMAPVAPQDFRPKNLFFWEAGASQLFRLMWEGAIQGDADWVHLITWNDYSEGTEIAPSTGIGYAFHDLTAYYAAWFKTGHAPTLPRDILYYFHRVHPAVPLRPGRLQPKGFTSMGPDSPRDEVELLAFLRTPGTLEVTLGGRTYRHAAAAGMTSFRVPLAPGRPRFALIRDGRRVLSMTSAWDISTNYAYQDLLYRAGCTDERDAPAP